MIGASTANWRIVALAMLVPLALHGAILALGMNPVSLGRLVDGDSYMRLVRVMELAEHGRWYDQDVARSNAPYGTRLPWSRVLDVLLLAGAWAGTLVTDFRTSLFWFGAISAPLFQSMAAGLIAWGSAPLLRPGWRIVAVGLFMAQVGVYSFYKLGRPDHHALQLTLMVAVAMILLRSAALKSGPRGPAWAGLLAALGLWVSAEALLVVLVAGVTLGLLWLRDGAPRGRELLAFAAAFTVGTAIFLMIERAPSTWLAVEVDKISMTHVLLGLGMSAAAGIVAGAGRRCGLATHLGRLGAGILLAATLGTLMAVTFPGFFAGPFGNLSSEVKDLLMADSMEVQPLWPDRLADLGPLFFQLGPLAVALPFAGWAIWHGRRGASDGYVVVLVGMAIYTVLALRYYRGAPFAEALFVVPWAAALAALWPRRTEIVSRTALAARLAAFALVLAGPALIGGAVAASTAYVPTPRNVCPWDRLAAHIDAVRPAFDRPIILTQMYSGPELLWRTSYDVVSAPFYDDRDGILDTYRVLAATDDDAARAIVDRRGVGLVIVCRRGGPHPESPWAALLAPGALFERLRVGTPPPWLTPVPLPAGLDMFKVYETEPPGG